MTHEGKNSSADIQRLLNILYEASPEIGRHFADISKTALQTDALTTKTKQLIALAISIILRSKECITFHLNNLIKKENVMEQEMIDLITVCIYMGGGPILMSAAKTLEEYYQLQQDHTSQQSKDESKDKQSIGDGHRLNFRENIVKGYE